MARLLLTLLLGSFGMLLARASRRREDFRAALSRERTVSIETRDGVAYRFVVRDRSIQAERGPAPEADFRLRFATAKQALGVLLSKAGVGRMLDGMGQGSISVEGNLMLFLWFQGRLEEAAPFAGLRRRRQRFPGAYTRARTDVEAARWIRREAPADVLDPGWSAAAEQRRKLLMMRVAAGEEAPVF